MYPLVSVDVGDVLPMESVHAVGHHERRYPLLAVAATLSQHSRYLEQPTEMCLRQTDRQTLGHHERFQVPRTNLT